MKNRKILKIAMLILMCLFLVACGGNKVDQALQGTWAKYGTENGVSVKLSITFDNGKVKTKAEAFGSTLFESEGTYTIKDKIIEIKYENGMEAEWSYEYVNGTLYLEDYSKE